MNPWWSSVHEQRHLLAHELGNLPPEQWETPSLCAGLSVREVLAHLTVSGALNPLQWFAGVARCRFDFDAQVDLQLRRQLGANPEETLARFQDVAGSTTKPPLPVVAVLGEVLVHGEDIRRPLGITTTPPAALSMAVAKYYLGSDLMLPGRTRAKGLHFAAVDSPLDHGDGALIAGPTLSLVMALTGRSSHLEDLHGPGVAVLRSRIASPT